MTTPTPEILTATIQARHVFTDAEIRTVACQMAARAQEYSQKEAELSSIKKEYSAKMEALELDRDNLTQKIRDGFEMRPTMAQVLLDFPAKGRKTFFRIGCDTSENDPFNIFGEEPMTYEDQQRQLPLKDEPASALVAERVVYPATVTAEDNGDGTEIVVASFTVSNGVGTGGLVTSLSDKLTQAAAGKPLPRVKIDFPDKFPSAKLRGLWRKAAKKQGWPEVCIDILDGVARDAEANNGGATEEGTARALDVLRAHSEPKTTPVPEITTCAHGVSMGEDCGICDELQRAEELAGTFDAAGQEQE